VAAVPKVPPHKLKKKEERLNEVFFVCSVPRQHKKDLLTVPVRNTSTVALRLVVGDEKRT
jgi:hypothetical protein